MSNTSKKAEKLSIKPLGDRVVVLPLSRDEVTLSGIIIPDSSPSRDKPERGTVVAVGPGKYEDGKTSPMTVKVGDEVLFPGNDDYYTKIRIGGAQYYILSESGVLAIL